MFLFLEAIPRKGNLVHTIGEMSPAFYIKFDFLVKSFSGPTWRSIIAFKANDRNCCNAGDRILPGIWTRNDGKIRYDMHFHRDARMFDIYQDANTNVWYSAEIMQYYGRKLFLDFIFVTQVNLI